MAWFCCCMLRSSDEKFGSLKFGNFDRLCFCPLAEFLFVVTESRFVFFPRTDAGALFHIIADEWYLSINDRYDCSEVEIWITLGSPEMESLYRASRWLGGDKRSLYSRSCFVASAK